MNALTTFDVKNAQPLHKSAACFGSETPGDHRLNIRDERFDRNHKTARWWHSDDPVATAWFNSLSASLPRGEAFFIDTLRMFRDGLPPRQQRELTAFTTQEINHTREHLAFNRLVSDHGYNVASIDKGIQTMLAMTDGQPKEINLAVTFVLEHFAAMISHQLLADPVYLEGADPVAAEMWRWHATEEVEHKGIAYDIWLHATRDWSRWKRYRVRTLMALIVTKKYLGNRVEDAVGLLEQDGYDRKTGRRKILAFLWRKPGMMRNMVGGWAKILLPGYHPWKLDDRALINTPDSPYEDARLPQDT